MNTFKLSIASGSVALVLAVSPIASADPNFEVEPVAQSTVPGELIHNPLAIKWNPEGGNKRVSIVESEGVPGLQAIEFQVKRKNKRKPWDIRMRAPFDESVSAGDEIDIYFWARAEKLAKGQDTGQIAVMLGRDIEPYDTIIDQQIRPGAEWKMYRASGIAERDFAASVSEMGFNMGFAKQTIQFGPFFAVKRDPSAE